jgi:hypothetical protein
MIHSGLEYKHEVFNQAPVMFLKWFGDDRLVACTSKS